MASQSGGQCSLYLCYLNHVSMVWEVHLITSLFSCCYRTMWMEPITCCISSTDIIITRTVTEYLRLTVYAEGCMKSRSMCAHFQIGSGFKNVCIVLWFFCCCIQHGSYPLTPLIFWIVYVPENICYLVVYLDLCERVVISQCINQSLNSYPGDEIGLHVQTLQYLVYLEHVTECLGGEERGKRCKNFHL